MLFGYSKNDTSIVVTGAKDLEVFKNWCSNLQHPGKKDVSLIDQMRSPDLKDFKTKIVTVTFEDTNKLDVFVAFHNINLYPHDRAVDLHRDMLEREEQRKIVEADKENANRTISDIYGLDETDPWDKRSEEEKKADSSYEKKLDKLRKAAGDSVTGESFDPNPRANDDSGIAITRGHMDDDGNITLSGRKGAAEGVGGEKLHSLDAFKQEQPTRIDVMKVYGVSIAKLESAGYTSQEASDLLDTIDKDEYENAWDYLHELEKLVDEKLVERGIDPEGSFGKSTLSIADKNVREKILNKLIEDAKKFRELEEEEIEAIGESFKNPRVTNEQVQKAADDVLEKLEKLSKMPKPKPEDYFFAFNRRLTENDAIGGKDVPIFSFAVRKEGPGEGKFGLKYLHEMLLPLGFEMVSGEIYQIREPHTMSIDDARTKLLAKGFVERPELVTTDLVNKINHNLAASGKDNTKHADELIESGTSVFGGEGDLEEVKVAEKKELTADEKREQLRRMAGALAGSGVSTVAGTGSYGHKSVIGDDMPIVKLKDRGVTLDAVGHLKKVDPDTLDRDIKVLVGHLFADASKVMQGEYTGHVIGGNRYSIPHNQDMAVVGEYGLQHLGANKFGDTIVDFYVLAPGAKEGWVAYMDKNKVLYIIHVKVAYL